MKIYPNSEVIPENAEYQTAGAVKVPREVIIDVLRGFAVLAMILTHVIAIIYSGGAGKDSTVYNLGIFGGIISFTAFLFISGFSTYYSAFKEEYIPGIAPSRGKIGRVLKILVIYYILATASIFVNTSLYSLPPSITWGENIVSTALFLIIPSFTEFLITLILFSLSIIFLKRFYKFLLRRPLFGVVTMIASYALGTILSQINLGSNELNSIKSIFGGHIFTDGGLHTFPVLQYFSIFLLGLYFGKFFINNLDRVKRLKGIFWWLLASSALALAGFIAYPYIKSNVIFPLPDQGRFPPSLSFLALSLAFTMAVLLIVYLIYKFIPKFVKLTLHFFGTNALEMLLFHTLLLFLYKYMTTSEVAPLGIKHLYLSDVLIVLVAVLVISTIFISLKNAVKNWSLNSSENREYTWWFFTERAISTLIFIIIFAVVGTTIYKETFVKPAIADTTDVQFKKRLIREEDPWWNHEFRTFRQINIENKSQALPMFVGSWVSISFDHEKALGLGNASHKNGGDLRVIYFNEELGEYTEVPFILENSNKKDAKISFKILNNINPGDVSIDYSLYYGNDAALEFPLSKDNPSSAPITDGLSIGAETFHNIKAKVNRKWFLKKKATAFQSAALLFDATVDSSTISEGSIITYTVNGTNKNGRMKLVGKNTYQAAAVVSDLDPGVYTIQANVTDPKNNLKIYRSQRVAFFVTYPIYVAWTLDWEGWDVDQINLNEISSISDTYQTPITHFFNPRIYVKNQYTTVRISEERAKAITNWVKDRQKNKFDEIGMHIHMLSDMVAESGVKPKSSPVIQGTYGFDIPTYVYTQAELAQVFEWGRQKLVENELGAPISYRTGAWMSGTNVLLAAQEAGFLIDSSGRTAGPVNPAQRNSTPVPWNLDDTTKPYLPNLKDINSWEGSLSERMKIWEFPNNGADSYWFNTSELVKRFDDNYPDKGDIVDQPQIVTYLSHPHWFFGVDRWKVRGLYDHVGQFLYKNDDGPVVYATLETIYSEWDKDKFINGD